jgi:hypothetical protein
MIRILLPVIATALLAGCNCGFLDTGCGPDYGKHVGGDWDTSAEAADDLWEAETDWTERTRPGEGVPDTAKALSEAVVDTAVDSLNFPIARPLPWSTPQESPVRRFPFPIP